MNPRQRSETKRRGCWGFEAQQSGVDESSSEVGNAGRAIDGDGTTRSGVDESSSEVGNKLPEIINNFELVVRSR